MSDNAENETIENEADILAQEDAVDTTAFEQAFHEARGDEPRVKPNETEVEVESAQEQQVVEEARIAGMTESEIGDLLAKVRGIDEMQTNLNSLRDHAFGKIGELNRNIQNLQSSRQINGKIDPEKLTRLTELDPEVAEAFANDLNDVINIGQASSNLSQDDVQSIVTNAVSQMTQQYQEQLKSSARSYEEKLLRMAHPDYQTVTKSQEFGKWLGLMSAEEQQQLSQSQDSMFVSDKLNEFKTWRDRGKSSTNKERLMRAVVPEGVSSDRRVLSDEDAFLTGFKKARGTL